MSKGAKALSAQLTKLSSSTTVTRFRQLESAQDRRALGNFIVERFNERYFRPFEHSKRKHGFAVLAIACLIIETLESFYQGRPDTKSVSAKMFRDFFARNSELQVLAHGNDWFYKDIRCGILHQSETRGGWRVLRKGPLFDAEHRAINATALLRMLQRAVEHYAARLETDEVVWKNFQKKMDAVCANCQ